jgi:ribose transport system permease protein
LSTKEDVRASKDEEIKGKSRLTIGWFLTETVRRGSGFIVGAILVLLFSLMEAHVFLTLNSLKDLGTSAAITAIIALGLCVPMTAGEFDLSIGYMVGAGGMLSAWLSSTQGMNIVEIIVITLLASALVGLVNAIMIVKFHISSFIATLGMGSIIEAFILAISNQQNIIGLSPSFINLGTLEVLGIPIEVIYVFVLAAVVWYFLEHTVMGRRLYAIGGGREAARLAGVNPNRLIIYSFIISAMVGGFAGIIVAAQLNTGSPDVGPAYLLQAFAAVFLGMTQIKPGRVNAWGTVLAVYVIALGVEGLTLAGAAQWVTFLFDGMALLVAVGIASAPKLRRVVRGTPGPK